MIRLFLACYLLFCRLLDRLVMRDNPAHRVGPKKGAAFMAAQGILPWKEGDELPEVTIRRIRDAPESGAVFDDMQAHDCDPNDPMDVEWYQYKVVGVKCKDCGAKLQLVRPGKVQCPRRKN